MDVIDINCPNCRTQLEAENFQALKDGRTVTHYGCPKCGGTVTLLYYPKVAG